MSWKARCTLTTEGPEAEGDTEKEAKDLAFALARDFGTTIDSHFSVTQEGDDASNSS